MEIGAILINSKTINTYDINHLRSKIGIVFQNSNIYALSVKENMNIYGEVNKGTLLKNLAQ